MKNGLLSLPAAVLLLLTAGCIRTDYVGQAFPERRHGAVLFFSEREKVPQGDYLIMGRLVLKAPNGTDGYDIQDKLIREASERGADAVVLVSSRAVEVGQIPDASAEAPQIASARSPSTGSAGRQPLSDSFGEKVRFGGNYQVRVEIQVKALLLIRKEAFEALRSEHPEEAEPLFMKEDPSGRPVRFPKAVADLPVHSGDAPKAESPEDADLFTERTLPPPEPQPDFL